LIADSPLSINRGLGKLDILDKRPLPDPGTSHGTDVNPMQSHDGYGEQEDDRVNGLVGLKVGELRLDLQGSLPVFSLVFPSSQLFNVRRATYNPAPR
jgi:hypothetical protein